MVSGYFPYASKCVEGKIIGNNLSDYLLMRDGSMGRQWENLSFLCSVAESVGRRSCGKDFIGLNR